MPLGQCFNANGTQVPCGPEDIGESYYQTIMEQDPGMITDWYESLLQPFMTQIEDEDIDFTQWLNSYGMYLAPMEFDMAAYNRIGREARLRQESKKLDFFGKSGALETQTGRTGFTGAGAIPAQKSMWSNFQRDIEGIKQGQLSEYQRFYGSYGQDVLNMVPALASTGAFVDPELGIPEDEISFGFETQEGDDSDYQTYNACYNGCVEDGNPHWECATACLD